MRLALLLVASLAVIGGIVWFAYSENQSSLARLDGEILKVRTYPVDANSTIVFADFRATNPGNGPFVVESLEMELVQAGGTRPGSTMTKREIDQVFAYQQLTGPQYNAPLIVRDQIQSGETQDRMAVAHFDLPESAIDARTGLRIRVHQFEGATSEFAETRANK